MWFNVSFNCAFHGPLYCTFLWRRCITFRLNGGRLTLILLFLINQLMPERMEKKTVTIIICVLMLLTIVTIFQWQVEKKLHVFHSAEQIMSVMSIVGLLCVCIYTHCTCCAIIHLRTMLLWRVCWRLWRFGESMESNEMICFCGRKSM